MKILLKIENYEKGVIIERLNRFVVKARVKNRYILAHLNNTGRLEDFLKKGRVGLFLPINTDYADPVADVLRRYGAGLTCRNCADEVKI
jgi:hypothetical protein